MKTKEKCIALMVILTISISGNIGAVVQKKCTAFDKGNKNNKPIDTCSAKEEPCNGDCYSVTDIQPPSAGVCLNDRTSSCAEVTRYPVSYQKRTYGCSGDGCTCAPGFGKVETVNTTADCNLQ